MMFNESTGATFDELSMQQSLMFNDSINDLKNLRSQLYSAAEYFELSYNTDDHKQFVVNALKDYTIKAIVNTIDHLGSVSSKINVLLDERTDEVLATELRVSCIEQRIRTCLDLIDQEGLFQQSLVITAPRYHKRYTLPAGETLPEAGKDAVPKYEKIKTIQENNKSQELQPGNKPATKDAPPSFSKKLRSLSRPLTRTRSISPKKARSPSPTQRSTKHVGSEKREVPSRPIMPNPLARSGSLAVRPTMLNSSASNEARYPSSPKKSISMRLHAERNDQKDGEQSNSKGKNLLKSFLSRRKSKKEDMDLYSLG